MTIRLIDIARRAGVSQATVSRALAGKPVSRAAREAVQVAIDVLGYERPATLRRRHAGTVGLIVPELTNPVFPLFVQAVEQSLAAAGYTPLLCTITADGVHEDEYVPVLLDHGVAGIVFVSGIHALAEADPQRYVELRRRGVPLAFVNGWQPDVDATFVAADDAAGVAAALAHLAELGHRRIGLAVGPRRYTPVRRRIEGYHEAMHRLLPDVDTRGLVQTGDFTVPGGAAVARELLASGATAIVAASDLMALGAIRAVRQAGLRVPDDVSVIGSDDSMTMQFTDPPLTTLRQDVAAMGAAAAHAVLDEIAGEPPSRLEQLFPPELVVRGSTARARSVHAVGGQTDGMRSAGVGGASA